MRRISSGLAAAVLVLGAVACAPPPQATVARPIPENFARISVGKSTANEVLELLGPPSRRLFSRSRAGEEWGYRYPGAFEPRMFWAWISADGIVRETSDTPDYETDRRYRY